MIYYGTGCLLLPKKKMAVQVKAVSFCVLIFICRSDESHEKWRTPDSMQQPGIFVAAHALVSSLCLSITNM
jgi:hypothetical protein